MMRLVLVRHGETVENASGIMQGHIDGRLNERGIEQAERVAQRLSSERIDAIYASDLGRVVETADRIRAYHHGIPVTYTYGLREKSKGIYEGQPRSQLHAQSSDAPAHDVRYEGGESTRDLYERVSSLYEKIATDHAEETVLFVSHGGPISALCLYLEDTPFSCRREYSVRNTSVSIISLGREEYSFELFDCVRHLED